MVTVNRCQCQKLWPNEHICFVYSVRFSNVFYWSESCVNIIQWLGPHHTLIVLSRSTGMAEAFRCS